MSQALKRRHSRPWTGIRPDGKPVIVNCHGHDAVGLCESCLDDFRRVLADVPHLLDDLDIAISGDVQFVERGVRADAEESKASGINPAVTAHQRLVTAVEKAGPWFDNRHPEQLARVFAAMLDRLADEPALPGIARDVSAAASRAHRVIDAPRDLWYYGPCPECGQDLLRPRILEGDTDSLIACPRRDYAANFPDHSKRILDEHENAWWTIGRLVSAITAAGEPITRKQIDGWWRHQGLARERQNQPRWEDGQLVPAEGPWTYRVGDVRDRAKRADDKRNGKVPA